MISGIATKKNTRAFYKIFGTTQHDIISSQEEIELIHLINEGINPFAQNLAGQTPLHLATIKSHSMVIIQLLLNQGADINAQNNHGQTPLNQMAPQLQSIDSYTYKIIELLLNNNAKIGVPDKNGNTLLMNIFKANATQARLPFFFKILNEIKRLDNRKEYLSEHFQIAFKENLDHLIDNQLEMLKVIKSEGNKKLFHIIELIETQYDNAIAFRRLSCAPLLLGQLLASVSYTQNNVDIISENLIAVNLEETSNHAACSSDDDDTWLSFSPTKRDVSNDEPVTEHRKKKSCCLC
ncbi:ankyrin repeat domain-containing protein [Candidatus Berkiella aquae]|uniref:Ankyrin repeat domain-containing protein n=1 Tax=Candidatus Berkiella aquae TaxID=295108 RepID=A0A0Q9YPR2_9GAMM|nr:ankyrin repeat domain-containing protein [Candidatus Berkiella aquae]MCS5711841.1 ankyrin repeat domain-containing protein [Candidatus Berkiella aquae]